jgi:hypothetical protein
MTLVKTSILKTQGVTPVLSNNQVDYAYDLCTLVFVASDHRKSQRAESIIEKQRLCRSCTSHFRGGRFYIEALLDCGV